MSLAYFTNRHRYWASWNRRTRRMSSVLQETPSAGPSPLPVPPATPHLPLPGEHGAEDHLGAEQRGSAGASTARRGHRAGSPRYRPSPGMALGALAPLPPAELARPPDPRPSRPPARPGSPSRDRPRPVSPCVSLGRDGTGPAPRPPPGPAHRSLPLRPRYRPGPAQPRPRPAPGRAQSVCPPPV